jgi:hypothetical protein
MLSHKKALSRRTPVDNTSEQGLEERLIYFQHFLAATLRTGRPFFGFLDGIALRTIVFDVFFRLNLGGFAGTTTVAHNEISFCSSGIKELRIFREDY